MKEYLATSNACIWKQCRKLWLSLKQVKTNNSKAIKDISQNKLTCSISTSKENKKIKKEYASPVFGFVFKK